MTIITPPTDESYDEPEPPTSAQELVWKYRRIKLLMDCKNWKCNACGCMVFGRCTTCPCCRHKLGKITERPKDWKHR